MTTLYDRIGTTYNHTRSADPWIAERLSSFLTPEENGLYLDIGCGSGNYTCALARKGGSWIGMDPSSEMLNLARRQNPELDWRMGRADDTGLSDQSIDGVVCTLSIHHWPALEAGFMELARVMKPDGRLVLFTSSPSQIEGYWLCHYFPQMMKESSRQMPTIEDVTEALSRAALIVEKTEIYHVRPDLQDHFLYCGKDRPELYLQPAIRQGISSFSVLAHEQEVETGLRRLLADLESKAIQDVIQSYRNDGGDYQFLIIQKRTTK